jgi:acyl-CoA reductase-like NAD-dependent aldehyde dehydrogenase
MGRTSPTRIDDEVFASAKIVGPVMGRSASQQVTHWARIGRELERSPSVSQRDIAETLAGRRDYDTLTAEEQAMVRAEWAERMEQRRQELDLAETFATQGRSYVELDDDGEVVHRDPSTPSTR